jgi:hypothetical protein
MEDLDTKVPQRPLTEAEYLKKVLYIAAERLDILRDWLVATKAPNPGCTTIQVELRKLGDRVAKVGLMPPIIVRPPMPIGTIFGIGVFVGFLLGSWLN